MSLFIILRIFAAVFIGCFISIIILEEDASVKALVGEQICTFMSSTYKCSFKAHVKSISIFSAHVELTHVVVDASDKKSWAWTTDSMVVAFSWPKLILQRVFALSYALYGVHARSKSHGVDCAILAHVQDLIFIPSVVPTELMSFAIHKGTLAVADDVGERRALMPFDLELLRVQNQPLFKITTLLNNGQLFMQQRTIVDQISGAFSADIVAGSGSVRDVVLSAHCLLPLLGQAARCHVQGKIQDKAWLLEYYSDDRAVHGTLCIDDAMHIDGVIPVKSCAAALGYGADDVAGQLSFFADIANGGAQCAGEYTLDVSKGASAEKVCGVLKKEGADFVLTNTCREHRLNIVFDGHEYFPKEINYHINNELAAACYGVQNYNFTGTAQLELLRPWLPAWAAFQGTGDISFTGCVAPEGVVVTCALDNGTVRIPLMYNLIKFARATCAFSFAHRRCVLRDIELSFYKGSVSAQEVVVQFNSSGALAWVHAPLFLHHCFVSWQKDLFALFSGSCLLEYAPLSSLARRCHSAMSGEASCEAEDHLSGATPLKITSYLLLERSHLRGNVLSSEFQKKLMSFSGHAPQGTPAIDVKVKIQTGEPVQIKTEFLDAAAHVDFTLQRAVSELDGFGEIKLERGTLKFPYKPLYITAGRIYFLPGQLYDPHIELTAKNTVKKYTLGMSIRGTVKDPLIQFESSPSLDEPQIITLLLGGSEDGSLYFAMPETLSRSLEKLVFGSAESSSTIKNYFRKLLRPLENIRIVPSFSDQTGRGGVRGSVAVEVNDRWRGFIEKNFNLSEDVKFGVEYDVSDDTSVRAVRDERGDIGGEIEMRWKL